ncbi:hypothetical protein GCM10020221_33700 [Streptomyces thioluteus]|uniref:Uncharacterized protein n=1 Tax=Streptomyces thioluteus TaxID=66431 RepID=A0ABN3X4W5_STRTU
MEQLAGAVEDRHLAGEHPAPAGDQLLLPRVGAAPEEDQGQGAAAVGDDDLQAHAPAVVEGLHGGLGDLGDDRDVLVERQVGQARQLAALGVAARVVVQQVTGGVQVEVLGHHLRGGAAEELLEGFRRARARTHSTPGH